MSCIYILIRLYKFFTIFLVFYSFFIWYIKIFLYICSVTIKKLNTMKKFMMIYLLVVVLGTSTTFAQVTVTPAVDLYSNYVWRGSKFGTGPSVQPSVVLTYNNFSIGGWGAFDAAGYAEADIYASYAFPFGLSIIVTDYYYPGKKYFDVTDSTGAHAFEAGLSYTLSKFTLSGYYIFNKTNKSPLGAGSYGQDKYLEASYKITDQLSLLAGAGDGWHTSDGKFNLCHIAVKSTKEIKVTDSFSIPVTGQLIFNPEREQFYVVVGLTF